MRVDDTMANIWFRDAPSFQQLTIIHDLISLTKLYLTFITPSSLLPKWNNSLGIPRDILTRVG